MLHFLGEQRRAVDLDQSQDTMRRMQLVGAFFEKRPLIRAFGVGLQRGPGVVQGCRKFFGDDVQSLRTDVGHTGIVFKLQAPKPLALRIFPELPALVLLVATVPAGTAAPEPPVLAGTPALTGSFKAGKRVAEVAPTVVVPPP